MTRRWVGALALAVGAVACREPPPANRAHRTEKPRRAVELSSSEPIQPLKLEKPRNPALVSLGRRLFHESRLSQNNELSCASCHDLANGGDDGRPRSIGVTGKPGAVNAPTVYNAALNFAQFWDGRAPTLEAQIDGPVQDPKEMGSAWPDVVGKLSADQSYQKTFGALFPDGVTPESIRSAIAAFERTLITTGSPFDRFLGGDQSALNEDERAGYTLFKSVGCIACHQGRNLGGNMFQKFGVMGDYFADRGNITEADYGRFNVTGVESDRFVFRVPSLRNVAKTAPYFHDGSATTLEDAVRVMVRYQLGRELEPPDVGRLVAFLETLTGELPSGALAASGKAVP